MQPLTMRLPLRNAVALLWTAAVIGALLAVAGPAIGASGTAGIGGAVEASIRTTVADTGADRTPTALRNDLAAQWIHRELRGARTTAGIGALAIDVDLVAEARRAACLMARGERALVGGGTAAAAENTGLVVDGDARSSAATMHAWWDASPTHRARRMDATAQRYGIGSCSDGERTYYVERFAG